MPGAIALDATYSVGRELTGVGIYSQEVMQGLPASHHGQNFLFCYRPHVFRRSLGQRTPANSQRAVLGDSWMLPPRRVSIFHGLNQRMPSIRFPHSVCTFHDLFVMSGEYSSPSFRARFEQQARDAAERAELIVAVSAFTASQVESLLGVERSRIRVVHHGIRRLPTARAERLPIILSTGAIQYRKNTARLIQAFSTVSPEWRLVLAGSTDGYGAAEALAAIETSAARDRIEVTGYLPPEELSRLYSTASVFAFPSLDEGFGMPVLEAMAHGVPVLASDRSALPEVCGEAALLVDPHSVESIANGLRRLTGDEGLRADLVSRGLTRASQFTWTRTAERIWSVYRELEPGLAEH